ncbi:hypothetical protein C1645_765535 [Glomus cerebriforme]|uniref:Uncharacterized protein n=1 Tax=Glomus cerebriforme TaxID=658196 RepID=A0A397T5Y4_9GLOM|nr:hypothetical protein C1645_765535 [Glomus cerebriforme]
MPTVQDPSLQTPLISTHNPTNKLNLYRIFNVFTVLTFFFSNAYSIVFARPSIVDISDKYPTYFTPSLIFIGIFWFILYILQFGFVFYAQLNDLHIVQEVVEGVVGWWFSIINLFMCGWLFFWLRENFVLSEIFILLTLISTSIAQHKLIAEYIPNHELVPDSVISFIHIPFSMFSAFSWLAVFYNGFIILSQYGYESVEIAIGLAWFLAILGTFWCITGVFTKGKRDFIFSFTMVWSLLGIGVRQTEKSLYITCDVLAITLLLMIFFTILKNSSNLIRNRPVDNERQQLLQHQINFLWRNYRG